jgi:Periplasmic binding protein
MAACSNRGDEETAGTTAATAATAATTAAPAATTAPAGSDTTAATGSTSDSSSAAPTTEAAPTGPMFGTMPSPCGPAGPEGVPTVAEGQNGGNPLRLGTAGDHGFEAQPGLTIEMLDAAQAFAGWCNEQGGIRGLPIEIVDLDGKLFSAPAAIEQGCNDTFALVGGGWVFDDQMFPRFNECKLISFAGYTVTAPAGASSGMVQPNPNPPYTKPTAWFEWAKENYPEAIARTTLLYGDFLTTKVVADQQEATMNAVGGYTIVSKVPYNPAGEANWGPFAQNLKDDQIGALFFTGTDANFILLARAMHEVGYVPELVLQETNFYTENMVAQGNAEVTEGTKVRTAYVPFEEADQFPGMRSYLDVMAEYKPDGKIALLGVQAMSSFLMFVTAANTCLDTNNNVLERECVLAAGKAITSWDGGGLHAVSDPSQNLPGKCGAILEVRGGQWTRVFPEIGSPDDDGSGFHCTEPGTVEIEGDFGDATAGVDPERPN